MLTATQNPHGHAMSVRKEQFLIVPIFFKKQIEEIIDAQAPNYSFGFFYGIEKDNYRIIKKIWPLKKVNSKGTRVLITSRDFRQARAMVRGTNLQLLGCFYTSENGSISKALLSGSDMDSFSFVELKGSEESCVWKSSICENDSMKEQKVIL